MPHYPFTLKLFFLQQAPLDAIIKVGNLKGRDLELFSESSNLEEKHTILSYQVVSSPEQGSVFLTKIYESIPWNGEQHKVTVAIYNEQRVFDSEHSDDADIKDL